MMHYNNAFLLSLGKYQVYQSYPFKTIIFASNLIHSTHFINKDKNDNFIADASTIRSISSNSNEQYRNGTISSEKYKDIMVKSHCLLQNGGLKWYLLTSTNDVEEKTNNPLTN